MLSLVLLSRSPVGSSATNSRGLPKTPWPAPLALARRLTTHPGVRCAVLKTDASKHLGGALHCRTM